MEKRIENKPQAGLWITANRGDYTSLSRVPDGRYAVVVESNGQFFTVDTDGNVSGDPAAVETEATSLGATNGDLIAEAAVCLARMAQPR